MAINMIDLLKDQLGGAVAGQLGKQVGLDEDTAKSGLGAILPTILGGLMKQASTPGGAETLDQTLGQDDYSGGLLEKLPDMLGGGDDGQPSMMTNLGQSVLTMLFGENVGSIAAILSKVTGMSGEKSGSLLALIAPLVMSYLGAKKRSDGLDASGLSSLLMSQKDHVAAAMPAGMAGTLGLADLGITDTPPPPAATPAPVPVATASSGGGGMAWLFPLILICGIGGLAYFLSRGGAPDLEAAGQQGAEAVEAAEQMADEAADGVTGLVEGASDITGDITGDMTGQLTDLFGQYNETFAGVTDEASAKEAAVTLQDYNAKLGAMGSMFDKLPESARAGLGGKLGEMVQPIEAMIEKLYAIPGVKPILEPIVSSMREKVTGMMPAA